MKAMANRNVDEASLHGMSFGEQGEPQSFANQQGSEASLASGTQGSHNEDRERVSGEPVDFTVRRANNNGARRASYRDEGWERALVVFGSGHAIGEGPLLPSMFEEGMVR
jgi:hypothetical protein